jgi:molybdopterin synthase sulfur carrier subunit
MLRLIRNENSSQELLRMTRMNRMSQECLRFNRLRAQTRLMADARILFLGRLAQVAGGRQRLLPLAGPVTIAEIIGLLGKDDPELASALGAVSVRVVVNQQILRGRDGQAGPGDEVAFLPPVSGG